MKLRFINTPIVEGSFVCHKYDKEIIGKVKKIVDNFEDKFVYLENYEYGISITYFETVKEVDDNSFTEEEIINIIIEQTDIRGINLELYKEKFRYAATTIIELIEKRKS